MQHYMKKFTTYIVNLMKKEKLFASQGGPIIMSQVYAQMPMSLIYRCCTFCGNYVVKVL